MNDLFADEGGLVYLSDRWDAGVWLVEPLAGWRPGLEWPRSRKGGGSEPMPKRPVTVRDVAARAQVDPSTVSRVLAGKPARSETRQRVLQAAAELGYSPNAIARSLRLRHAFSVGVLVPDITNPFFAEVIDGAQAEAEQHGYFLLLMNTREDMETAQAYLRVLEESRVDGLMLATALTQDRLIEELRRKQVPFVLVNRRTEEEGDHYVIVDGQKGAYMAVEHLVRLGHRRIAHISGPLYTNTALDRLQGYRLALREFGLDFAEEYVAEAHFQQASGRRAMERLLQLRPRPTAVFCANDLIALGALSACHEAGLHVPGDVSLVGFNDIELASQISPPLTTVAAWPRRMGAEAARMLIEHIEGGSPSRHHLVLEPRLVVRGSTGPVPAEA